MYISLYPICVCFCWLPFLLRTQDMCLVCAKSLQSCPTLCNPIDCSPPGSSVHGILQTRILEWVAPSPGIFPTQGLNSCLLCLLYWRAGSLPLMPSGKPWSSICGSKSFWSNRISLNKMTENPVTKNDCLTSNKTALVSC